MMLAPAGYEVVAELQLGCTDEALRRAWDELERPMRCVALRFTKDRDVAEDLVQEALIELWLIDPSRFRLSVPCERRYLRRMLVRRMWDVWRSQSCASASLHNKTTDKRYVAKPRSISPASDATKLVVS